MEINDDSITLVADSQQLILHCHRKFSAVKGHFHNVERDIHLDSGSCSQNAVTERVPWNALPSEHGLFSRG